MTACMSRLFFWLRGLAPNAYLNALDARAILWRAATSHSRRVVPENLRQHIWNYPAGAADVRYACHASTTARAREHAVGRASVVQASSPCVHCVHGVAGVEKATPCAKVCCRWRFGRAAGGAGEGAHPSRASPTARHETRNAVSGEAEGSHVRRGVRDRGTPTRAQHGGVISRVVFVCRLNRDRPKPTSFYLRGSSGWRGHLKHKKHPMETYIPRSDLGFSCSDPA
jgi:hypothetical protein